MISFIEAPILFDQLNSARKSLGESDPRVDFISTLQSRLVGEPHNRVFHTWEKNALDEIFVQTGLYK